MSGFILRAENFWNLTGGRVSPLTPLYKSTQCSISFQSCAKSSRHVFASKFDRCRQARVYRNSVQRRRTCLSGARVMETTSPIWDMRRSATYKSPGDVRSPIRRPRLWRVQRDSPCDKFPLQQKPLQRNWIRDFVLDELIARICRRRNFCRKSLS